MIRDVTMSEYLEGVVGLPAGTRHDRTRNTSIAVTAPKLNGLASFERSIVCFYAGKLIARRCGEMLQSRVQVPPVGPANNLTDVPELHGVPVPEVGAMTSPQKTGERVAFHQGNRLPDVNAQVELMDMAGQIGQAQVKKVEKRTRWWEH